MLLPKSREQWRDADSYFASTLVPLVNSQGDVDAMNTTLCDGIYDYFASHYGTKPSHRPTADQHRNYPRHQRELKRLRKAKVAAMRELRLAQQGKKPPEVIRSLKGAYLKVTRWYSKALKKSKIENNDRMSAKMKKGMCHLILEVLK